MSVDTGREQEQGEQDPIASLALRKAAAFEELTRWLGSEIGIEWSTAMSPEWVVSMLRGALVSRLDESRRLREGRRARLSPWLRRAGW